MSHLGLILPSKRVILPSKVSTSQFTQHAAKSVLTYTPRTPADFGKVTCTGMNAIGKGKPCIFQIVKKVNELESINTILLSSMTFLGNIAQHSRLQYYTQG